MENVIDKYFMDYRNVNGDIIVNNRNKITPKDFYNMVEPEQENSFVLMKPIECKDGFIMSVQACYSHYCQPRITFRNNGFNIYSSFEVGFPNKEEELLLKYAEDKNSPANTVYGQVPKETINAIIKKHGGLTNQSDNK